MSSVRAPGARHRQKRSGELRRRSRIVVAVFAVVLAAWLIDAFTGRAGPSPEPRAMTTAGLSVPAGSLVPPYGAESSAWFCVGGVAGVTDHMTIELTNTTVHPVTGTIITVISGGSGSSSSSSATTSTPVTVPAEDQIGVSPPGTGSKSAAATVLLGGGGVAVSEVVSGSLGWSTAPCASSTSAQWSFAHASTSSGSSTGLLLYNPAVTPAVVDVSLYSATAGLVAPPAYQGVPVPAGALVVENIGDHLLNDSSFATEVSASSGTVVAVQLQSTPNGSGGGVSLLLGAQAPAERWSFPQNLDPSGGNVVFYMFNPSPTEVSVKVNLGLTQGEAEPLSLSLQPDSVSELVAEHQTRIPVSSSYSVGFVSAPSGIVVDREVLSSQSASSPQVGQVRGEPGASSSWMVPAVSSPGSNALSLAIADASSSPVTATVRTMAHGVVVPGLSNRVVEPAKPLIVTAPSGSPIGADPLLISASGPVTVELDAGPAGASGIVVLPAFAVG
jgi:hypothetical protein